MYHKGEERSLHSFKTTKHMPRCPQRISHSIKTIEGNGTVEIPTCTKRSPHSFKTTETPTPTNGQQHCFTNVPARNTVYTQGEGPGPTSTAEHLRSPGDVPVHTQRTLHPELYSRQPMYHKLL